MTKQLDRFNLRAKRVRNKVVGTGERPRVTFHRGLKYLYAQVIDDTLGITLVSANTSNCQLKNKDTLIAARLLALSLAKKTIKKGIKKVVIDRKGYRYIGKIKILADVLRDNGILC
ncbi:MAG: 50S ribosomal protein L18 [Endomicrobium sp.]|nr:50S ribosomal protein L18 [Endomicrobium sp.]